MDLQDIPEDDSLNNLPKPSIYKEKLNTLEEKLPSILDDFKKYYRFTRSTPENPEYQQIFKNIQNNLQELNSQMFTTSNAIQSNTDVINEKLLKLDIAIREAKVMNRRLKIKARELNIEYNGSDEMIENYTELYNIKYANNFSLVLGIIGAIVIYKNVYL